MNDTGFLVLVGAAGCVAVLLVRSGWRQPRPSLDRQLRHLRRSPARTELDSTPLAAYVGHVLVGVSARDRPTGSSTGSTITGPIATRTATWRPALRLLDRDPATHVGSMAIGAIAGLAVPGVTVALLQFVGVVDVSVWVPTGLAMIVASVVPVVIHADAMSRSADRRIDVRHQLSAYLDMVTMLLAGNTGHEGALGQAASAGDGLLFRELRRRMREVATVGDSLVRALSLVGEDFGVVELEQVADAAALSAAEGAPVARTLAAKCSTLRSTLAAEQEASARLRTDKVTPPLVGMALLFMALIIYPALALS